MHSIMKNLDMVWFEDKYFTPVLILVDINMTSLRLKYNLEKYEDENREKLVEGFSETKIFQYDFTPSVIIERSGSKWTDISIYKQILSLSKGLHSFSEIGRRFNFNFFVSVEFESSKQKWFSEGKEIPMNRSESPGKVQYNN